MNDTLSPLEIATVVSSFFGIAYVFVRAGTVPRQVWRGPVAAFGSGILSILFICDGAINRASWTGW